MDVGCRQRCRSLRAGVGAGQRSPNKGRRGSSGIASGSRFIGRIPSSMSAGRVPSPTRTTYTDDRRRDPALGRSVAQAIVNLASASRAHCDPRGRRAAEARSKRGAPYKETRPHCMLEQRTPLSLPDDRPLPLTPDSHNPGPETRRRSPAMADRPPYSPENAFAVGVAAFGTITIAVSVARFRNVRVPIALGAFTTASFWMTGRATSESCAVARSGIRLRSDGRIGGARAGPRDRGRGRRNCARYGDRGVLVPRWLVSGAIALRCWPAFGVIVGFILATPSARSQSQEGGGN